MSSDRMRDAWQSMHRRFWDLSVGLIQDDGDGLFR